MQTLVKSQELETHITKLYNAGYQAVLAKNSQEAIKNFKAIEKSCEKLYCKVIRKSYVKSILLLAKIYLEAEAPQEHLIEQAKSYLKKVVSQLFYDKERIKAESLLFSVYIREQNQQLVEAYFNKLLNQNKNQKAKAEALHRMGFFLLEQYKETREKNNLQKALLYIHNAAFLQEDNIEAKTDALIFLIYQNLNQNYKNRAIIHTYQKIRSYFAQKKHTSETIDLAKALLNQKIFTVNKRQVSFLLEIIYNLTTIQGTDEALKINIKALKALISQQVVSESYKEIAIKDAFKLMNKLFRNNNIALCLRLIMPLIHQNLLVSVRRKAYNLLHKIIGATEDKKLKQKLTEIYFELGISMKPPKGSNNNNNKPLLYDSKHLLEKTAKQKEMPEIAQQSRNMVKQINRQIKAQKKKKAIIPGKRTTRKRRRAQVQVQNQTKPAEGPPTKKRKLDIRIPAPIQTRQPLKSPVAIAPRPITPTRQLLKSPVAIAPRSITPTNQFQRNPAIITPRLMAPKPFQVPKNFQELFLMQQKYIVHQKAINMKRIAKNQQALPIIIPHHLDPRRYSFFNMRQQQQQQPISIQNQYNQKIINTTVKTPQYLSHSDVAILNMQKQEKLYPKKRGR